ncbi:hypothetical protein H6P81_020160 [Aristolochia fimbriata]|uniref:BAT2 N-terminal domain-containing protein n=1 Tax=Aristolochia fimbriata TaxID=158543 RepID=A0AAV7DTR8_ARIFI|nr:hypothetical protein H6P81_020160 [Aristolochia fimbriata]
MASSMLGERRWTSARRGGMTVLGKVTVPKPVNLPSQRLENHGLDPNVEIVPKGTLSWGSRTSSSSANAWGSSMLSSPSADGSGGSPGRLNARPSSGGSGTRPSTAGSDRSAEPSSSAWGPSSRPSSASGLLASSQSSVGSLRPRSAETRPGSSQRSRFAESVGENSVAWGGTSEGLSSASSKPSSFTLSSGDFPTLGSEKSSETNARQGHSSHGRPSSSSGVTATQERLENSSCDDGSMNTREKGDVGTWKRGEAVVHHGGPPPSSEKWQRDNQQGPSYHHANVPPHHFDPWHGAIRNHPPDGVWYRGGPPPGPYGPAPPAGYGLEPPPYGYYHPQSHVPGHSVPNSLSAPRPGPGPGGFHSKSGDTYRPLPDSYVVPGPPVMPVRYPGPLPPYDGYYGPPRISYRNPSEQDAPAAIGMAGGPGPSVFNRYPNQNAHPDAANFHTRPGAYGPSATTKEPTESGNVHDTPHHGPYKVLLKQQESWGDSEALEKDLSAMTPHVVRGSSPQSSSIRGSDMNKEHESTCPSDYRKSSLSAEGAHDESIKNEGEQSIAIVTQNLANKPINTKLVEDDLVKKQEKTFSSVEGTQQFPSMKKNPSLIDKIEGLNSKARISDGRYESKRLGSTNFKPESSTNKANHSSTTEVSPGTSAETDPLPTRSDEVLVGAPMGAERSKHGLATGSGSRPGEQSVGEGGEKSSSQFHKRSHWVQSKGDHRGKNKPSVHESEEWRKKSSPMVIDASSHEAPGTQETNNPGKVGDEHDTTDYEAQRAKMKEIAVQRAKQLQKEEEERTREQKAKAMAKLEELNRRTSESSEIKLETNMVQNKLDETPTCLMQLNRRTSESSEIKLETNMVQNKLDETPTCLMHMASAEASAEAQPSQTVSSLGVIDQTSKKPLDKPGVSVDFSKKMFKEAPVDALLNPVQVSISSVPLGEDVNSTEFVVQRSPSQLHDNVSPKQKQVGYRRKQNDSREKNLDNKSITLADSKDHAITSSLINPANTNALEDTSTQHKKKHSRNGKNKLKLEEGSSDAGILAQAPLEGVSAKLHVESGKLKPALPVLFESGADMVKVNLEGQRPCDVVSESQGLIQLEETHGNRGNQQWKPHPNRRMSKSTQASRPMDKFHGSESVVWAPVKPTSKQETPEEASLAESYNQFSGISADGISTNLKSRRAEIERYVPKPVAKELSQQSNSQQPPHTVVSPQAAFEEVARTSGSDVIGKVRTLDTKNGESKNNKHSKAHISWRQRSVVDASVTVQNSHDGSASSTEMEKPIKKLNDQTRPLKSDSYPPKEQRQSDNWNAGKTTAEPVSVHGVKDHGAPNRGKRQHSKLNQGVGGYSPNTAWDANFASDSPVADKPNSETTTFESSESDGKGATRHDSQVIGERGTSHWQPKMQTTHQSRHGTRVNGGQKIAGQLVRTVEKDNSSQGQSRHPISPENKPTASEIASSHNEHESGWRVAESVKEAVNFVQQGPENADRRKEQPLVHSGPRRQGQHQGQFSRGHNGASYEGGGRANTWHESSRQQIPSQGERRKHNSTHYEYQPVGSYKANDSTHHVSGATEESVGENASHLGSRYREHGQNYSRRGGHFPGRNRNGALAGLPSS